MLSVMTGTRLNNEQFEQIKKIAESHSVTPATVIRWAVIDYLREDHVKPQV